MGDSDLVRATFQIINDVESEGGPDTESEIVMLKICVCVC